MSLLRKDFFRGARFVPVGVATTFVDGAVVGYLLLEWGREHAVAAGAAGWACGYLLNFLGHKLLTFYNLESGGWEPWRQLLLHLALKLCNLGLRSGALLLFAVHLQWDWGLLLLALIPLWNYLANRWIFTREPPAQFFRVVRDELSRYVRAAR